MSEGAIFGSPLGVSGVEMTEEDEPLTEIEEIELWRFRTLIAAGYPADYAGTIAQRHDIDLHVAVSILTDGCPLKTALNILL